jgi:phage-related protein
MAKGSNIYPVDYISKGQYSEGVRVEFYKTQMGKAPLEEFIGSLRAEDRARFAEVYEGIKRHGFRCPRLIFKPLIGKLWEIKFNAESGGYRIVYVLLHRDKMIWLHAFKKSSQKTLKRDLDLAKKRMKEVLNNEK